jgi:death-on-curing protein
MTLYLDPEVALTQLTRIGFVVRDAGLLSSALARPRTSLFGADAYPSLASKIAALMDSVVNNHPMLDGNKRSSWILANLFAELNGHELIASTDEAFTFIHEVATGEQGWEALGQWIEAHLQPLTPS